MDNKSKSNPDKIKSFSLISIFFLYGFGFWAVYKAGFDTTTIWGTIMIIWGWLIICYTVFFKYIQNFQALFKKQ